ncbi:hypothetical protein QQX98_003377 [Neonectria punicea]|uniref:NB-ARC domain-containing protein n=1 Tax=Neonectria punicea TaxID=979145 RepID=A0ABR1HE72_9HYPO
MLRYLPDSPNGSVLFTTRSKQAAVDLAGARGVIAVTEPSSQDCIELLSSRLPASSYRATDLETLAKQLGYLPLALAQVTSYLQKRSLSVSEYLEMLSGGGSLIEMLQDESTEPGRQHGSDSYVTNAVARTWLTTFRNIDRDNRFATELLYLCGCFERQDIPHSFLVNYTTNYQFYNEELLQKSKRTRSLSLDESPHKRHTGDKIKGLLRNMLGKPSKMHRELVPETPQSQPKQQPPTSTTHDLKDSISLLVGYSFLKANQDVGTEGKTFALHPLVQLVLQRELQKSEQMAEYVAKAAAILNKEISSFDAQDTSLICNLMPHINAVLARGKGLIKADFTTAAITGGQFVSRAAWSLDQQSAQSGGREWMWKEAIALLETALESQDPDAILAKRRHSAACVDTSKGNSHSYSIDQAK